MLKQGVKKGGEARMEKMGKKTEMRGGFTLLDAPPKVVYCFYFNLFFNFSELFFHRQFKTFDQSLESIFLIF